VKFGEKKFIVRVDYNAGVMVLMRPCGVIAYYVLYHHESLSQLYLLIDKLLRQAPGKQKPTIAYLVFDYGCGAEKFFELHPAVFQEHDYERFKCFVDRFHFGSHKDEFCLNNCNPDHCPGLDYINTEACEQLFSWLGKYKFQVANMSLVTYTFYLNQLLLWHNRFIMATCQIYKLSSDATRVWLLAGVVGANAAVAAIMRRHRHRSRRRTNNRPPAPRRRSGLVCL